MIGIQRIATVVALATAAAACSSETNGPPAGSGSTGDAGVLPEASAPSHDATLTLEVPATLIGTPRQLDVVAFSSLPIKGPPAAVLYERASPAVTPGVPIVVRGDVTGVTGELYVVAVLYMNGGGQFSPKAGVDYAAYGTKTVRFDGAAMDLGSMKLTLEAVDGGP
jgi:hypothetical protein